MLDLLRDYLLVGGMPEAVARWADEQLTVRMPEGELAYRLLSLPLYLAEKLPALEIEEA